MAIWAALIGGGISLLANKKAGDRADAANQQALAVNQEAQAVNQAALDRAREDTKPARDYLMRVVSSGSELTPLQQQYVADTRQQTGAELSSRLGGRSATAIATKAAENVRNATTEANRQRADTAALNLANPNISGANISMAGGQAALAGGQTAAQIAQATGASQADNILATGKLIGQGIGTYYAQKSNQDLIDAIRSESNSARKSSYPDASVPS